MRILQASYGVPIYEGMKDRAQLEEHIVEGLKRTFYSELDKHLAETPGGIILGQPTVSQRDEKDLYFGQGDTVVFNIAATCEDLPLPPEYRLIGGPADGSIVRTRGERVWFVPFFPRPPSIASYAELSRSVEHHVAEYERQGDTSAYFFKRISVKGER